MSQELDKLRSDLVYGFVSWCDANALSLVAGADLAERLGDDLSEAADDRRMYLPPSLTDEEEQ